VTNRVGELEADGRRERRRPAGTYAAICGKRLCVKRQMSDESFV
jgi:hypothetical protein